MLKGLFFTAAVLGATAVAAAEPTQAQTLTCLPRAALVERLESRYKESLAGGGMHNPHQLLEVWASEETGSFTVFLTRRDGVACILATGQHWTGATQPAPEGVSG